MAPASDYHGLDTADCAACNCVAHHPVHRIVAALAADDIDEAIELGLLHATVCPSCTPACTGALLAARDVRRRALDARERYRARQLRLDRRAQERAAARAMTPASALAADPSAASTLPSAAALALARAKARAAARHTS